LKFSYTLSKPVPVNVSLADYSGRSIKTLVSARHESGEYTYGFTPEELNVPAGEYIVQFTFGETRIPVKVILR
ncbi:MAG TPA: hypothetical protein VFM90_12745, partial [Cyclobacteriaceae bacterium]|nr:hypothetical protein [Cyclobacteriaceae bacterium]